MSNPSLTTYQAGLLQAQAYRALKNFMVGQLQNHRLTMMEWALLGHVYDHGKQGIRTSSLAQLFGVEASLMTNMINRLEMRGLVDRRADPLDARAKRVCISANGKRLVAKAEHQLRKAMERWLGGINRNDLRSYLLVLHTLAAAQHK